MQETLDGRNATFAAPVSRVTFRPVLACRLVSRRETVDEYAAEVGWSLVLEEV